MRQRALISYGLCLFSQYFLFVHAYTALVLQYMHLSRLYGTSAEKHR